MSSTLLFEAQFRGGYLRGSEEGRVAVYAFDQFPLISPERAAMREVFEEIGLIVGIERCREAYNEPPYLSRKP